MSEGSFVYRRDIDGLRAVAIILVTVFHFDLFGVGKAGFIGVDVFFVISGFLITSIIVRDLERERFHFGSFLYRRVRRLYPALIATTLSFLVAGWFLLLPDAFRELSLEVVLSQLYVINFYFWRTVNYFGLHAAGVPLLHMWSLAIEEQFYLIFPLVCLLIWKLRPGLLLPCIAVALLLSFFLGLYLSSVKPWAAFYLLPTRAWELLAGGLLAMILQRGTPGPGFAGAFGLLGLVMIVVSVLAYNPATQVPGWYALLPTSAAICLIVGGFNKQAVSTRLLSTRPMVWIGLISYPLYLVHWPILYLQRETLLEFTLSWRIFGFCLSFALATLVYLCVENPIRTGRWFQTPKRYLMAVAVSTGLIFAGSLATIWQQGMPQRFDAEVSEVLAYQDDDARLFRSCQDRLARDNACRLGQQDTTPDILVFGDSHANAFAHAIDIWLKRSGRSADFSFSFGCLPVRNMGDGKCVTHFSSALDYVERNPNLKQVMILAIWRQPYDGGMLHNSSWIPPGEVEAVFAEELEASVAAFRERGVEVILVEPFYGAASHVPKALAKNLAFGRNWPVDRPVAEHQEDFAELFEAFARVEETGAQRISLIGDFCGPDICAALWDGKPIFTDNNHLSDAMSGVLSNIFEREMGKID